MGFILFEIVSEDFKDRPCNCCRKLRNRNGQCVYRGKCRRSITVYKATCKDGHYYIGSTQQHLKLRFKKHFNEVRDLIHHGKRACSFAAHVANCDQLKEKERISAGISGIHFGQMKACAQSQELADFEATMNHIPYATGYSPHQW